MQECKNFENFPGIPIKYSLYIHGYLFPWFQQQREQGKIKQSNHPICSNFQFIGDGKIKVQTEGNREFEYEGEVDLFGRPCGKGKSFWTAYSYESLDWCTWLDGKNHGISKKFHS